MSFKLSKRFVSFMKRKRYGFTIEGELHIYVGGNCTSWKQLLPIFKKALIEEYKKLNNG